MNNLRYVFIIVATVLLLRIMGCVHSAEAQSTVPTKPDLLHEFPKIITNREVWESAETKFGISLSWKAVHCPLDYLYVLPTKQNVQQCEKFRLRLRDGEPYRQDAFDCDDFAREFLYYAKRWSYHYYVGLPATVAYGTAYVRIVGKYSLAEFGEVPPDAPAYHALNVYIRNDGQWFFVEPQNGRSVEVESMLYEGIIEVLRLEI